MSPMASAGTVQGLSGKLPAEKNDSYPPMIFLSLSVPQLRKTALIVLTKLGVDISRLADPIRRKLTAIDMFFFTSGSEVVITSTFEGNHMPSSFHYCNLAIDLRRPSWWDEEKRSHLQSVLGEDYDVLTEPDHIHIEYDPD